MKNRRLYSAGRVCLVFQSDNLHQTPANLTDICVNQTRTLNIKIDLQTEMPVFLVITAYPIGQVFGSTTVIISLRLRQIDPCAGKNGKCTQIVILEAEAKPVYIITAYRWQSATGNCNRIIAIHRRIFRQFKSGTGCIKSGDLIAATPKQFMLFPRGSHIFHRVRSQVRCFAHARFPKDNRYHISPYFNSPPELPRAASCYFLRSCTHS